MTLRDDFPLTDELVYLDSAATTLTPEPAVEEMSRFMVEAGGNYGRGSHRLAREVTGRCEDVREQVKDFLGVEDHVLFTRGTTEAINAAAQGLPVQGKVVTTALEHHSNLAPWMREAEVCDVVPHRGGELLVEDVAEAVDDETALVAVTQVSNVYGSVLPVDEIGEIAEEHDALLLVDAAQSAGHTRVDMEELGADLLAFSGHKGMLGPQGVGGLCVTDEVAEIMEPLLLGGGAVHSVTTEGYELEDPPRRFEAGTPNIPGVVGLGAALDYLRDFGVKRAGRVEKRLASDAAERLAALDGVTVHRPGEPTGVLSFTMDGWNPHDVANMLDRMGDVCLRSGHHCAMLALDGVAPNGTIRASFALYNTEEDVDALVENVEKVLKLT